MSLFGNAGKKASETDAEGYTGVKLMGNWKIVDLPEIPIISGEEDEEAVLKVRCKLYRWKGEWKERGVGTLKVLRHKKSGVKRLLVRAEKTHKCLLNHFLEKKDFFCKLEVLQTAPNTWTWSAFDISDGKPETQKFCAKFSHQEDLTNFQKEFELGCTENSTLFSSFQLAKEIQPKKDHRDGENAKEEAKREQ